MKKRVLIVTAPLNIGGFDIIATNLHAFKYASFESFAENVFV